MRYIDNLILIEKIYWLLFCWQSQFLHLLLFQYIAATLLQVSHQLYVRAWFSLLFFPFYLLFLCHFSLPSLIISFYTLFWSKSLLIFSLFLLLHCCTKLLKFFQFLYYFISLCFSLSLILLQTFLQLLFKLMKVVNKIFQICSTLFHFEPLVISCLCKFFKSLFTQSTFLNEIFSELFLLIKWVYDSVDLWFGLFYSFLEFDENLLFFLVKA